MKLSPREHEVLTLVACGYSDKETALKLRISKRTVEDHINSIRLKLRAKNRVNAVAIYLQANPKWRIEERAVKNAKKNHNTLDRRKVLPDSI